MHKTYTVETEHKKVGSFAETVFISLQKSDTIKYTFYPLYIPLAGFPVVDVVINFVRLVPSKK